MTSPSVVRMATEADAPALKQICALLHEENGLLPLDENVLEELIFSAVTGTPTPTFELPPKIGVIGDPGVIEGSICMRVGRMWYSQKLILEELWNFVHPSHRKSEHAKSLIEFSKKCQNAAGVPLLIGVLSTTRTKAKLRLYERQLGEMAGGFFLYSGDKVKANGNVR